MIRSYRLLLAASLAALWLAPVSAAPPCQPLQPVAEAVRETPRHDHGLLWEISRGGRTVGYLFGTMHVSDPAITRLPEPVSRALESARRFVMEVELDGPAMLDFARQMFYRDGRKLSEVMDAELYARAETLLLRHGIPEALVQTLKPWAAFVTLNMPPDEGLPLDLVLMNRALELGLPVAGLESIAEQVAVFEDLSEATQIALLADTVCHYKTLQADMDAMKKLYLQRDLAGLYRYHDKYNLHAGADYQQLLEQLLWQRNRLMAERIRPMLGDGIAFIAIGAMHLPGRRDVLRLLEDADYQVEAIY